MNLRRLLSLVLTGMAALAAGCVTTQAPVERTPPPEPVAAKERSELAARSVKLRILLPRRRSV